MNKQIAIAALGLALTAPAAFAQGNDNGPWLVRGRILNLHSANKNSDAVPVSINNKTFPEFDVSYFFSPNLAAELVLTYPQKQDVRLAGSTVGSLKHLPPTLSMQYHFTGMSVRPYVGAGLNYTMFSSVNLPTGLTIKKSSTGAAFGAGVDIPMGGGWLANVDVKKVQIKTDISSNGAKIDTFKVDPTLFSVGVGYRF